MGFDWAQMSSKWAQLGSFLVSETIQETNFSDFFPSKQFLRIFLFAKPNVICFGNLTDHHLKYTTFQMSTSNQYQQSIVRSCKNQLWAVSSTNFFLAKKGTPSANYTLPGKCQKLQEEKYSHIFYIKMAPLEAIFALP